MTISGPSGEVKHGYYTAVSLGAWTFVGTKTGGSVTAALVSSDAFRLTQTPLRVVVPCGRTDIVWPVVSLQITGTTVTALVGEKE